MSSTTSSSISSSSSSSRPRSSSWLQIVLFTILVYILLFSTACCHAVPVWQTSPSQLKSLSTSKVEDGPAVGAGIPSLPSAEGEFANLDSILQRCMQAAENGDLDDDVFVKTLCTLTMIPSRHLNGKTIHKGYVKRGTSDRTSFSAFNRFVNRLRSHADEVSEYQDKLERLQAIGAIDSDYNVIALPDEMLKLMHQLG